MKHLSVLLSVIFMAFLSMTAAAQYNQLDPKPYDPEVDADIDMYMHSWTASMPYHTHGSLIERDLLTKGNPLEPERPGAVLTYFNRYSHATLEGHGSTIPTVLKGEQEVFYLLSGKGTITSGSTIADLYEGIAVLVPVNVEFTLTNTDEQSLKMLLINEPVPDGFVANDKILIKDMNTTPYTSSNAHWAMNFKDVFAKGDGTSAISCILIVTFDQNTMGHPHSHGNGFHEIWTTIDGDTQVLLGKQLRDQPPGTAYMVPPDGKTPHSNINVSDDPVTLFHFRRNGPEF